jgi:hypothetical protein
LKCNKVIVCPKDCFPGVLKSGTGKEENVSGQFFCLDEMRAAVTAIAQQTKSDVTIQLRVI